MFCKVCLDSKKQNSFTEGCETFRTSSMSRHENTSDHISCQQSEHLKKEMNIAMHKANEQQDVAVIKAMKVVYWLASENIPLSKFESQMKLLKGLEVPGLSYLNVSDRIDYVSYYSANELLEAISATINDDINEMIKKSPFVTVLADESTDISNTKRMTMTARIINPDTSTPSTVFLQDVEYEDGSGAGLASEIVKQLEQRDIPLRKLIGFGSDGASVMTGHNKGVYGRLKELNPHIINIHCMAHRLALCTSQAAHNMPLMKKYQEWLTQLFYYFKQSATREKELHKIQELLSHPTLKYKEIHAVRWLSFYQALEAVYRTMDPLLTYLHNRDRSKDPKAKGLLKFMATRQFFFITYLMMDVIPIVSKLCLTFQSEDLNVAKAKIALDLCLTDLEAYKAGTNNFKTHLEEFDIDVAKVDGHFQFKGHCLTDSNTNFTALKSQFINKLISNIKERFPKKSMVDAFYVLAMRTIDFQSDISSYGVEEIGTLLEYFGEEQIHNGKTSQPMLNKEDVKSQWEAAKTIVRSAKYPVDNMTHLWELLTTHHSDSLNELIKLAQIGLILPLHTSGCERVFSQQNLIVTKQRSRISPIICDRLLCVRLEGYRLTDYQKSLVKWHSLRKRIIKSGIMSSSC